MNPEDEMHVAMLRKAYGRPLATLTERQERALQAFLRDVWAAARTEGEKARHAAPARKGAGVVSSRNQAMNLATQLMASASTIIGMRIGSTTLHGAEVLLLSACAWLCVSLQHRLWIMGMLNVGLAAVSLANLWTALA